VVKVGSSLVTNEGRGIDHDAVGRWAGEIAGLRKGGKEIVLVSSGAIAEGMQRLGWAERPAAMHALQAAAAVGQMGLVHAYETAFARFGLHTAQILLTHEDLSDRRRYLNARSTITTLLSLGVIPVINENDTVTTDEIRFGDNDTLGALVTNLIEAEVLVLLTDQPGLYRSDPRKDPNAELVRQARAADPTLEAIGTELTADTMTLAARKQWLADHVRLAGKITLDAGAVRALTRDGKSLLPIGVIACSGTFERGAVVACCDPEGREIARGLINYSAAETQRIMRKPSSEIAALLGYVDELELIHRNNLVLL